MFSKFIKIIIPIILIGIILLISYSTYKEAKISIESPITVIPTNSWTTTKLMRFLFTPIEH